jgi:hypothetical protein
MGDVENPAYKEAKKYEGKGENDKGFVVYMSTYWKKVGLPGYKTIVGSSFAWCALFMVMANTNVGQQAVLKAGAAAYSWRDHGTPIDWRKQGIPQGAEVRLNHKGVCNSWKNNHVGYADGDCAATDLIEMVKGADGVWRPGKIRKGATIALYGGNQGNLSQRSVFGAGEICDVNWPKELKLPSKVTRSLNCTGKGKSGASTR